MFYLVMYVVMGVCFILCYCYFIFLDLDIRFFLYLILIVIIEIVEGELNWYGFKIYYVLGFLLCFSIYI